MSDVSYKGPEVQGADAQPRRMTLQLRPQDVAMFKDFSLGDTVSIAVRGEIESKTEAEYGCSVCLEVEFVGVKKPEPETFVEQMKSVKVLKS